MLFWEVSAKTNENQCVNSAIEKLVNEIFDKVELDYETVSENWVISMNKSG